MCLAASGQEEPSLLTAKTGETDKLVGLGMGTEDYLIRSGFTQREAVSIPQ